MRANLSHRLRHHACLVIALALSLLALQASGSPADITYRSSVSEVRLTFFASDEHHRGVSNLQAADIAVVDDGTVIRNFRSFELSPITRLQVVVLLDESQSVLAASREEATDVLRLISDNAAVAEDRLSVISFGGMQSKIVCAGNCRSVALEKLLTSMHADGATPLFDALEFAGNFITRNRDPEARPVLILFSDGEDTISKTSSRQALEAVFASEAPVYAVDLNQDGRHADGSSTLEGIAAATGGQHLRGRQGAVEILNAVLQDLRAGYLVSYRLPNQQSGFHWVRVLPTHNAKLQFRCRNGYVYQPNDR
ncbi:MAG TPA: VWA domain-containing protein [Terriglobales bacterium]|nr:VWA domain-containing protein [Terriglobales bacterium]